MRHGGFDFSETIGRFVLTVIVSSLLFLPIAVWTAHAQEPSAGRVSVRVVNAVSGEPMGGVEVWLLRRRNIDPGALLILGNPYEGTPTRSLTNTTGLADFPSMASGTYGVQLNGFDTEPREFQRVDVKEAGLVQLEVRAIPHVIVEGTVTDERGVPIGGANVELLQHRIANTTRPGLVGVAGTRTDSRGRYRIASRIPGNLYVRASAPQLRLRGVGTSAVYYPNTSDFEKAQPVALTAGKQISGIDLRISQAAFLHIRGEVEGFTGVEGFGGQALRLWAWRYRLDSPEAPEGFESLLLPDGRFDIAGVPPGHYYVTVDSAPLDDPNQYVFGAAQVDVKATDVNDVRIRIQAPRELRGVIRLEAGMTMPRYIDLESWGPPLNNTVGSHAVIDAASGTFVLPDVIGREYSLRIEGPRGTYVKSAQNGLREITGKAFIPDTASGLTIDLGLGRATLTGTVVPNASLSKSSSVLLVPTGAIRHSMDRLREAPIQQDGSFQVDQLAPGTYKLLAWQTYDRFSMQAPEFLALFEGESIEVTEEAKLSRTVRLIPAEEAAAARSRF